MRLFTLTIFIFYFSNTFCQSITDSLYFVSQVERDAFQFKKTSDHFTLLYSIGNENNTKAKEQYEKYISFISEEDRKLNSKKPQKRIKGLYEAIHEKHFSKYVENPIFKDIFDKGEYNCVTATGMYALAFEHLNIPYSIRQIPSHVYIIAFPKSHRIILETTDPINGTFSVDSKKLDKYKDELINSKTIAKNEGAEFDADEIFEDFVLADSSITISNLIGLQYYNASLTSFENNDFKEAYFDSHKAQVLCEDEFTDIWSITLGLHLIENKHADLEASEISVILKKLIGYYRKEESTKKLLNKLYIDLAQFIVVDENDIEKFNAINIGFAPLAEKDQVYKEIYNLGNFISAEYYTKAIEYSKALRFFEKSYNEENTNHNLMIQDILGEHLGSIRNASNGLDSLARYENIFPFLKKNKAIQSFGVWCYQKLIYNSFELNEIDEGLGHLQNFESKYVDRSFTQFPDDFIGNIYGAVSAYFVRKKDYVQARNYLRKGLKSNPECLQLRRKLKMLDDLVQRGEY